MLRSRIPWENELFQQFHGSYMLNYGIMGSLLIRSAGEIIKWSRFFSQFSV